MPSLRQWAIIKGCVALRVDKEKTSSKNQSAVKALDIIEFLANGNNEERRLQDIANGLSMNVSTVLRFLTALADCGYVRQNPATLRYSLTMKICTIANGVSANIHLFECALPFMKRVSEIFQESVCLAIDQDMTVVYIGAVQGGPSQMMGTMQRIGNRAPLHCTGIGKLLLTQYSEPELDRMIAEKGLPVFTQNTVSDKQGLMKELQTIRQRGYAFDNEECEIGARCVAAPVHDYTGRIVAGMSVTGTIFHLTDEKLERFVPRLMEQAGELSHQLGYLNTTNI